MTVISEVARGIQQFSRTGDPQNGRIHPVREVIWLAKRAVQEDKTLNEVYKKGVITEIKLYLQRLKEIGSIFTEIFAFREYSSWQPQSKQPRIIDLGGDIGGFSVLYWKSVAPQARITLVEANPSTATVVAEGFKRKGLQDVQVINAAVSDREGLVDLYLSGYNPSNFVGRGDKLDHSSHQTVSVPTIRLSELVGAEHIDLLKIDIEGSEGKALRELAKSGRLGQVDIIMMEFHNDPANPTNSFAEVLQILDDGKFQIENVHVSGKTRRRKIHPIDICSITSSKKILFALMAKRNK